jgi:glutathione S-transferase
MDQAHTFKLISFELCPFVERSRIVLAEKGLTHEVEFIDLRNKPGWFLSISPMGRVPVLLVDQRPIFESLVINELVDELYPTPSMLPADPLARAEARAWMIFANDQLMTHSYKAQLAMAAGRPADAEDALASIRTAFGKLEEQLERHGARYFLSDNFGLVDAALAPFFRRWQAAEAWGEVKVLGSFPRLAKYVEALLSHSSVAQVAVPELGSKMRELYLERMRSRQGS